MLRDFAAWRHDCPSEAVQNNFRALRTVCGIAALSVLAGITLLVLVALPPVRQDDHYHSFADQRVIWGIPNFYNVMSNIGFLMASIYGVRSLRSVQAFTQGWERTAYAVFLIGVALTAFGSGYYHLRPDTQTLFWDRLPMTVVFMSILATTIGERISMTAGRLIMFPLLAGGVLSVFYWRSSGDLRWYGVVQFIPMIAMPVILILFPSQYSKTSGTWGMLGLYAPAKIAELFDRQIAFIIKTGGHPWKHVAGAAAIVCYATAVAHRKRLPASNAC